MGMSASQARYLSLTARKSDLEYRGQQINQSRLMLSNQSANLYSSMLSMSVPTPPVETDYMKDVYTFSMNGDTVTLTSSKLSMGRDGYNYDIIYSRPESKNILASSATSDVQKSITRKASNGSASSENVKIKVGYKNADGDETFTSNKSPKKTSLITMSSHIVNTDINSQKLDFDGNGGGLEAQNIAEQLKKSKNFNLITTNSGDDVEKSKISFTNLNSLTYVDKDDDTYYLTRLTNQQLAAFFGGNYSGAVTSQNPKYNAEGGLLEKILGTNDIDTRNNVQNAQVYMDQNGDIYVASNKTGERLFNDTENGFSEGTTIKKYSLTEILGLTPDTDAQFKVDGNANVLTTPVYYTDMSDYKKGTDAIISFWQNRWLGSRLNYEPIYERVRCFNKQAFLVSNQILIRCYKDPLRH